MTTSAVHIAWAAGLFEGEGCAGVTDRRPYMQLGMTDGDVVYRFQGVVSAGTVRLLGDRPEGRQDLYLWTSASWSDIERIAGLFLPYLGARRVDRLKEVLAAKPANLQVANERKTHCPRGHRYDHTRPNGWRRCRRCDRDRARGRRRAAR